MQPFRDKPFLFEAFETVAEFVPATNSLYVCASGGEPRASLAQGSVSAAMGVSSVQITSFSPYSFKCEFDGRSREISLRSTNKLDAFWNELPLEITYLDITGLPHHVWAPLLKAGLKASREILAVYVEPEHYQFSTSPTEGGIFDLSEKITGVAPIPGFTTLSEGADENVCFVPLLGFEGTRLAHILEQVQPPGGRITPVIGVPGFKPEYAFYTYQGNQRSLLDSHAWKNVRFACANNPFSLFYVLQDISSLYPYDRLKVAPIGTKPHALGAILFALASTKVIEIVYDHPIRKVGRTRGSGKLFVYEISAFMRL